MRIIFFRPTAKIDNNHHLPVSVIICARNEAENLQKNLPKILAQDYPEFEVIIVNDGSEDNSLEILNDFKRKYHHLQIVNILPEEKITSGKKGALQKGIESARYASLLMTDADCYPVSDKWIQKMLLNFSPDTALILGVAPYENKGKFLHDVVDYETITTLIQYIGYALWGLPYMGVGRNISYTQGLYNKVDGFKSHIGIASGDDDLFVQEAVKYTKTAVCLDKESYMYSKAPDTFGQWWHQKVRHYTTGAEYRYIHQVLLGMFILSKFFIYAIISYLFVTNQWMSAYVLPCLCYVLVLSFLMHVYCRKYLLNFKWYMVVVLDVVYVGTILAQGLQSKLTRKSKWK